MPKQITLFLYLLFGFVIGPGIAAVPLQAWSLQESLRQADVIVVGELVSATAVDTGSTVNLTGTLQVSRPIAGEAPTGGYLRLTWEFPAPAGVGPSKTTKPPRAFGLWFLKRNGESDLTPLRVSTGWELGGVCLELPRAAPAVQYDAFAPRDRKLALEASAALEWWASASPADLVPQRQSSRSGMYSERLTKTAKLFRAISDLLFELDLEETAFAYRRLSALPSISLQAIGLAGRLRLGEADAVYTLEAGFAQFAATSEVRRLSAELGHLPEIPSDRMVHALGRMAVHETEFPGFEIHAAHKLGYSRSLDAMPYLLVMLESPNESVRGSALGGVYTIIRRGEHQVPALGQFWDEETRSHCPTSLPVGDRDEELVHIQYWRDWWTVHREELENSRKAEASGIAARFPDPPLRSRYTRPVPPEGEPVEASMEQRLHTAIGILTRKRRNSEPLPDGSPGRTILSARLDGNDDLKLAEILADVSGQIEANNQKARDIIAASRLREAPPEHGQMASLEHDRTRMLGEGLRRLETELSPEGWDVVSGFLKGMNIKVHRVVMRPPDPQSAPRR